MGRQLPPDASFAARRPDLVAQWHPTRNPRHRPETVWASAPLTVWWICEEGHEWQARISARTQGARKCPTCRANRRHAASEATAERRREADAARRATAAEERKQLREQAAARKAHEKEEAMAAKIVHLNQVREAKEAEKAAAAAARKQARARKPKAGPQPLPDVYGHVPALVRELDETGRLTRQYHPERNASQLADGITAETNLWWMCTYGHEWQATLTQRLTADGRYCHACWVENDGPVLHPPLVAWPPADALYVSQRHPEK